MTLDPNAVSGVDLMPRRGVAAHRGGAAHAPENTLAALREAVRLGAHQVEFDVRATADGRAIVIHDDRVDRTTDGRGRVAGLTWDEIRRLDAAASWPGRFDGERVPGIDEALECLPRNIWINVQIKYHEPVLEEVVAALVGQARTHQAFLACGRSDAARARSLHPGLLTCDLVRRDSRDAYVEHAVATGADFVQLHQRRGPPEAALVDRAHARGLRVNHFCDGDEDDLESVFAAGVDFVLVDDVAAALAVAARLGIPPLEPEW